MSPKLPDELIRALLPRRGRDRPAESSRPLGHIARADGRVAGTRDGAYRQVARRRDIPHYRRHRSRNLSYGNWHWQPSRIADVHGDVDAVGGGRVLVDLDQDGGDEAQERRLVRNDADLSGSPLDCLPDSAPDRVGGAPAATVVLSRGERRRGSRERSSRAGGRASAFSA